MKWEPIILEYLENIYPLTHPFCDFKDVKLGNGTIINMGVILIARELDTIYNINIDILEDIVSEYING